MGQHRPGGVVHTEKIQFKLGMGVLRAGVLRRAGYAEACVVHQNVNLSLPLHHLLHSGAGLLLIGDIGSQVYDPLRRSFPS